MPNYKPRQIENSDRAGRIADELRPKSKALLIRIAAGIQLSGNDGRMLPALRKRALLTGNAITDLGRAVAIKLTKGKKKL